MIVTMKVLAALPIVTYYGNLLNIVKELCIIVFIGEV